MRLAAPRLFIWICLFMVSSSRYRQHPRFSELSRRGIAGAQQSAAALNHPTVGIGHLLLALLLEARSPAAAALRASALDEACLRARLAAPDPLLLVSIEQALARAPDEAERLGSHYTGTEHLLLALALMPAGARLLAGCGADAAALAARIGGPGT